MNTFISLESIEIATPCRADWNKMTGDEQSRHCQSCHKNVYNFSEMTRAQAQRLIEEKEGHLCVRLHRRADGTVITSDCPIGISPVQKSAGAFKMMMAAAVAAVLGVFGARQVEASKSKPTVTTGAPMVMGKMAQPTMGKPAIPPTMGDMGIASPRVVTKVAPKAVPKSGLKAVKMPVKNYAKRTSGKSTPKRGK